MTQRPTQGTNRRGARRWGRGQLDDRKDPYQPSQKPPEPTVCPDCGAVFHRGRWQWSAAPEGAHRTRCEACQRIHDQFPAGTVTLAGKFTAAQAGEIEALVRHQEKSEKADHPLNRVMSIERADDETIVVTTTDIHLPHRIARAVEKAFGGHLTEHYEEDGDTVRIAWRQK